MASWASPGSFVNVALAPSQLWPDSLPLFLGAAIYARPPFEPASFRGSAVGTLRLAAPALEEPAARQPVPDTAVAVETKILSGGNLRQIVLHAPTLLKRLLHWSIAA